MPPPHQDLEPDGGRRVAVVHYWLENVRGGEKVFFELARCFPGSDLFVLRGDRSKLPSDLVGRRWTSSYLDRRPWAATPYRATLPFLPRAVESLSFADYDLVISSSSGWAHGVVVPPGCHHVCYMHSPPRYLWDESSPIGGKTISTILTPLLHRLRQWDVSAASRVDEFIANSRGTADKIAARYGRNSAVVYPPVDVDAMLAYRGTPKENFAVVAGELVRYKRFDVAVRACALARLPLVVIGDGPERGRLRRLADGLRSDVRFLGRADDESFRRTIAAAKVFLHPAVEDFGIATVEALAVGTPVLGNERGGTAEILGSVPGIGAVGPTIDPGFLADAIRGWWTRKPDVEHAAERARNFAAPKFRERIRHALG